MFKFFMKRYLTNHIVFALLVMLLVAWPTWSTTFAAKPEAEQQASSEQTSLCLFFTETGEGQGGFAVTNEGSVMFASAFEQWGVQKTGYPISHRYERNGFVTQAFQKVIMQWRSDTNSVVLVNVFDDLRDAGHDNSLESAYQVPQQLPLGWDGDLDFQGVVNKRQALLDVRPALANAYFASGDPLTFYGLPTSEVQDMDTHYAIRLQRAVLQEWKIDVPWAQKGQVTIANGGQITKELGVLSGEVTIPTVNNLCSGNTIPQVVEELQNNSSPEEQAPAPEDNSSNQQEVTPVVESNLPNQQEVAPVVENSPSNQQAAANTEDASLGGVCTEDPAMIEIENALAEPLTVHIKGFESGSVTIPARGIKRVCLVRTYYDFSTESESFRPIAGNKAFLSLECECWKLFFLFPWQEPCTCSNNPDDYRRLP